MSEPVKKSDGWYVMTPDGESGPWMVRAAAEAAASDEITKANIINNRAMSREKVYGKGSKK